jgi:hypothetical protein
MLLLRGSIGWLVKMLQEDLDLLGYNLAVDGIFGPLTEAAVKDFQTKQGIAVDGIVGPITWGKMEAAINVKIAERNQTHNQDNHKLLATISGQVVNDAFYFGLPVKNSGGTFENVLFLFDTGAFEMLLTAGVAQGLGLPDLGPAEISGIGGLESAYNTQATFKLSDNEFTTPAVVDENTSFGINLFGLKFCDRNQLTLELDLQARTLSFYAYIVPQGDMPSALNLFHQATEPAVEVKQSGNAN